MSNHGKRASGLTRDPRSRVVVGKSGKRATTQEAAPSVLTAKAQTSDNLAGGGPSKGKPLGTVSAGANGTSVMRPQLQLSDFPRPAVLLSQPHVMAASQGPRPQRLRSLIQPLSQSSTFKNGATASSPLSSSMARPHSFLEKGQRTEYALWFQQLRHQQSIHPSGHSSALVGASATCRPMIVAASAPGALPQRYTIASTASGSHAAAGGAGVRLQRYLLLQRDLERPLRANAASSSSLASQSSCHDSPTRIYRAFTAAASHGRSSIGDFPVLSSNSSIHLADSQRSISTLSKEMPQACCGFPIQATSFSELFTSSWRPPAGDVPPAVNCQSAIRLLQDAEEEAAALVLAAQEKARTLRAKAKTESETEALRLRSLMETSLEAIREKHKSEQERDRKIQEQKDEEISRILEKNKRENRQATLELLMSLVLKVDVECPVEAIKLFGTSEQLLTFKKSQVQHHPDGELLLRPEDYITWDEKGRALLKRDAIRHRKSFGSFWTKHQSKVRTSDRPAVLVKPPSFVDPLDRDINRRLPSLWEPDTPTDFQPFKLPSFAMSSSSSAGDASSEDEPRSTEGCSVKSVDQGGTPGAQDPSNSQCVKENKP